MNVQTNFLKYVIGILFIFFAGTATSQVAPSPIFPIQEVADLLAGQEPKGGLPASLKENPKWKAFGQAVQTNWDLYSSKIGVPMMEWAKAEIPEVRDTVFYPFSGPDFTTVYQLFPHAKRYVLIAMQNAEKPLNLGALSPAITDESLDLMTIAWQKYGVNGFFVTEYLDKYLYTTHARIGASTFLLSFLKLQGFEINRVVPIAVRANGEIEELPLDTKSWRSVRFNANKQGRQVVLDYLKMDLSNQGFETNPANLELIRREAAHPVLFKAASHLPQNANFNVIANEVIQRSPLIVQDETGVKYSTLASSFNVALYGKFVIPHHAFKNYHDDLAKAFAERTDVKALSFRFGYFKEGNYALMIATRKAR